MSRSFWVAVGAAGGIVAYRRGTRAVERARELGPLGSAQLAAQTTSNLAGKTANGLGRLQDARARRAGRLVLGSAEAVGDGPSGRIGADAARDMDGTVPGADAGPPIPADWVAVEGTTPSTASSTTSRLTRKARR